MGEKTVWEIAIGGPYVPSVWGKHQATHPTSIAQAMRIAMQRAPECADVIAALLFWKELSDERAKAMGDALLEHQCRSTEAGSPLGGDNG